MDGYHGFDAKIERGTHDDQPQWEIGDTKPLGFLGEERKETGGFTEKRRWSPLCAVEQV